MKIILDTSSSNQEFINGLEELLESSGGITTQIIVHSEDECGIAADAIGDTAKRLGVEITWDKNVVLEDIPDIIDFVEPSHPLGAVIKSNDGCDWDVVDFVEPNPFGRGDEPACPLHQEFYDKLKTALYEMPSVEDSVSYEDAKDAFDRLLEEEFNV